MAVREAQSSMARFGAKAGLTSCWQASRSSSLLGYVLHGPCVLAVLSSGSLPPNCIAKTYPSRLAPPGRVGEANDVAGGWRGVNRKGPGLQN